MDLNDVSGYFYNNLELVSDYNTNKYGLFLNSKFIEELNLQNKSINCRYKFFNFQDGYKNKGLKYNCTYPKRKFASNINNNINFVYISDYIALERLHKFNLNETFPIVIYNPSLNEDDFMEKQIYGFE